MSPHILSQGSIRSDINIPFTWHQCPPGRQAYKDPVTLAALPNSLTVREGPQI